MTAIAAATLKNLTAAVDEGRLDDVRKLLDWWTMIPVLRKAGEVSNVECAKLLLRSSSGDVYFVLMHVFQEAVKKGQNEYMKLVQALKPSHASAPSAALYRASEAGFARSVKKLVDCGADVNGFGFGSFSPLQVAAKNGHVECTNALLAAGANVHVLDAISFHSALHIAAGHGHPQIVAVLICHGADVNAEDIASETPLHWAAGFYDKREPVECIRI